MPFRDRMEASLSARFILQPTCLRFLASFATKVASMYRSDFQKLAEDRIADAGALFEAHRYDAAYYLAGYAVECALKACIAKRFPRRQAQEYFTFSR